MQNESLKILIYLHIIIMYQIYKKKFVTSEIYHPTIS